MSNANAMLEQYPGSFGLVTGALARCIDACTDCAQTCTACADACLGEEMVAELTRCIRLNADCADLCAATSGVLSRQTHYDANVTRTTLEACIAACRACGDECAGHAEMHEHCRTCAAASRACEEACRDLLAAVK